MTLATSKAIADPWLAPGDESVRSDILLLADAGVLRGPVTTWPLSWPDIARDALAASAADLDDATAAALTRVQRLSRAASASGFAGAGMRVRGAYEPTMLRTFADTPREEGELALRASWLSDHFAVNLQGSYVADPDDGKDFRADGSYVGVNFGNFMLSAGLMERWWGPGWDGSLILSTNARPIPGLTLERNYTDPFETKLLSWIGPWRASIAIGEAESHDVAVASVRFMAARVNFRPRTWLEVGLTRTAQWCGRGRQCGWQTFTDMLMGRDNQDVNGNSDDQPGNQMAGYDLRLHSPWRVLPLAVYTQLIGEDEAGGFPSKFVGLVGIEGWTSTSIGALRVHFEYADTTCEFTKKVPEFNCAYRNGIYPQGYTYRRRVIGDSMDNDSRMYSLGALLTTRRGDSLSALVRHVVLNRDGGPHAISEVPLDLDNVELAYSRMFGITKISVGLGYDRREAAAGADPGSDFRGFVVWQQGF
jgi:hypothetical protein